METKTLDQLVKGEILLVNAKKINGGKISLEFAQLVDLPNQSKSILGLLNKSDERFNVARPRHAWESAVASDASELFGIDFTELENAEVGSIMELNILNPTIQGQSLNIEIRETTVPTAYQAENPEVTAKRAGQDGEFIVTQNGEFIYSSERIVMGAPNHQLIGNTKRYNPSAITSNNPLDAVI